MPETLLKFVLFHILIVGGMVIGVPLLLLADSGDFLPFDIGPFRYLGILPVLAGIAVYLACNLHFHHHGKGSPAMYDPPKHFVAHGIYRYTRNPIYVSYFLFVFGEAILFESAAILIYTAVLIFLIHLLVVIVEEPTLKERFGPEYEAYVRKVPRWLPRIK